ncbi:hypothetical protein BpHYR1_034401 [Brachionus plicatilis]|uniref:Uncharacterized protein n=1 Tax=Brachionus plicatilis TaxID=10195 RepID=A0A3M7SVU4_BRAPC|nr:hypothetical protein BpHYR1_034401 [Brachionus plicatilis]
MSLLIRRFRFLDNHKVGSKRHNVQTVQEKFQILTIGFVSVYKSRFNKLWMKSWFLYENIYRNPRNKPKMK